MIALYDTTAPRELLLNEEPLTLPEDEIDRLRQTAASHYVIEDSSASLLLLRPETSPQTEADRARLENAIEEVRKSLPAVSIGEPMAQPLTDLMPVQKLAELNLLRTRDMYLVRLFCSFHSRHDTINATYAEFRAVFRCDESTDESTKDPLIYDLEPRTINTEARIARRVSLDPRAKFCEVELGAGALDFTIQYTQLKPIIAAGGDGEHIAYWEYRRTKATELIGGKQMYAIIHVPKGTPTGYVHCDLTASIRHRGYPFRGLRPSNPAFAQHKTRLWLIWIVYVWNSLSPFAQNAALI